jgi:hypothetical protein
MTKYERELRELESGLKYLPRSIKETKTRGRKLQTEKKRVRKARARIEFCRVECHKLPKLWTAYAPHGKHRDLYARPEVTAMHNEQHNLRRALVSLQGAQQRYDSRHADRAEYRKELRALPEKIACVQSLIEIAAKRKKPVKAKNAMSKFIEIVPGYVVEKARIVSYCRTLATPPRYKVSGDFYELHHDHGYIKFAMRPMQEVRA